MQTLSLKQQLEQAGRDKKQVEVDLFSVRDQLRDCIKEKLAVEGQLHTAERVESQKQADLQYEIHILNANLAQSLEENKEIKGSEENLKKEVELMIKARDSFKQQFLELREINKDLKD